MSYADYSGLRGMAGQSGGIPNDIILRKYEQSDFYEDPNQVDNHLRSLLVDFSPDKPFFESDMIRSSNDAGGGFGSRERLNMREGGARSLEEPYLPDGTFTDWDFAEKDPRGTALGPDMRKHYEQQMARAQFIKKYNDEDYSVTESMIAPAKMLANITSGRKIFKKQFKNFDESFDAWHNGGTSNVRREKSDVGNVLLTGTILDLTEATNKNRSDALAWLSADPTIAPRHSTPDHRFKISHYGMIRANKSVKDMDLTGNRLNSATAHAVVEINGEQSNKMLSQMIVNAGNVRKNKQDAADGAIYSEGMETYQASKKLKPADVYAAMILTQTSAPTADGIDGSAIHRHGLAASKTTRNIQNQAKVNHFIAESLTSVVRKISTTKPKDLRRGVQQSMAEVAGFSEANNRAVNLKTNPLIGRESLDTRHIEASREIRTYSGIKPSQTNRVHNNLQFERFGSQSRHNDARNGRRTRRAVSAMGINEDDQDLSLGEFATYTRANFNDATEHMGRNATIEQSADFGEELGGFHDL